MDINQFKLYLEVISLSVTILGVPVAIFVYLQQKLKERRDREYGTYNSLDDKYIEFLMLCLENVDLDIYYVEKKDRNHYTAEQNHRELIIFEILISLLERAFLMYREHSSKIKKEQWNGWNQYMHDWQSRENFRRAWEKLGHQWDIHFEQHMNKIYEETKRKAIEVSSAKSAAS